MTFTTTFTTTFYEVLITVEENFEPRNDLSIGSENVAQKSGAILNEPPLIRFLTSIYYVDLKYPRDAGGVSGDSNYHCIYQIRK